MLEDTNSLDGAHMQTDQMFRWNYIGNWYVSLNISTIADINSVRTPLCYLNFLRFVLQKERWDFFEKTDILILNTLDKKGWDNNFQYIFFGYIKLDSVF